MKGVYFISGIDTNIGKSYATGYLAKKLSEQGVSVITQKMIQTGNINVSEDIELHRKIMNIPFTEADHQKLTAPFIFSHPCSPHLAAKLDNRKIDLTHILQATEQLQKLYDVVLLEGAGGLMVPITETYLTIDYLQEHQYPLIFVTSGKLGSLNHTLLNFEIIKSRNLKLEKVIYNLYPQTDSIIEEDSLNFIQRRVELDFPGTEFEILEKQ